MSTLHDSLVSTTARRLRVRKRPDLLARRQRYQGRTYWVVKEPVGLNYFRLEEEVFAILEMLDGQMSLDEIRAEYERRFPPEKIGLDELQQFIGTLHGSGLVIADVPGQGTQLKKRRDERKRSELWATLSNVLAIRFKGIDPDRLLDWMLPAVRWLFAPVTMVAVLLLGLSALLLVAVQFDTFRSRLPEFHQFFSVENAFWLAIALGTTKVLHEFGHGLSCKHFGGECHEMGVMVLVLTPCLYCNVSDSWMLPNKWHRAFIGAAGMYVEIILASLATYLWWFSEPGLVNNLALSTMFVCSVSTIVFNGNPLLRYDGYYILSDILEIPNLRQKSSEILGRKLGAWCLGLEETPNPLLPQGRQWMFAVYSVAAAVYKWFVALSILWFLYKLGEPYGLKIVGQAIAMASLFGLVVQPLWKLGKFFWVPGRLDQVKKARFYTTLALVGCVLAFVCLVPLPNRVFCTFEVQPLGATPIYVDVPGRLDKVHVQAGKQVKKGQSLARLVNLEAVYAVAELEGQEQEHQAELDSLAEVRFRSPDAGLQVPRVEENLKMVRQQLEKKRDELALLELVTPTDGTVLPAPQKSRTPHEDEQLPTWHGSPLEPRNLGCSIDEGELFCQVGDPAKMQAILVIDQSDVEFVVEGHSRVQAKNPDRGLKVDLVLDSRPGKKLRGQIVEIANEELKVSPKNLSNKSGGELATKTDDTGIERPMNTSYQARVPLSDSEAMLLIGLKGKAKIHAGYRTLAQQAWRLFAQTFNFEL
ncbi:MAG: biotin/lipoyl-binding protein [Pirellulales bacterium]|nr:biotin/lipoyl-binding protein [Pirellulales bacterium]